MLPELPGICPHPARAQVCALLSKLALSTALSLAVALPTEHRGLRPESATLPTDGRPSVSALDIGALDPVRPQLAAHPSPHPESQGHAAVVPAEEPPVVVPAAAEPAPQSAAVSAYAVLYHSPWYLGLIPSVVVESGSAAPSVEPVAASVAAAEPVAALPILEAPVSVPASPSLLGL